MIMLDFVSDNGGHNLSFRDGNQHIAAEIPEVECIISTILSMVTFAALVVCMSKFDLDSTKNSDAAGFVQ